MFEYFVSAFLFLVALLDCDKIILISAGIFAVAGAMSSLADSVRKISFEIRNK